MESWISKVDKRGEGVVDYITAVDSLAVRFVLTHVDATHPDRTCNGNHRSSLAQRRAHPFHIAGFHPREERQR